MVDPSTCFTGSSLVPVDRGGNVLKCHILLRAQSQGSLQLMLIMSRHLLGRKGAQKERWQCVCSHTTPCTVIVKMSDLSLPSLPPFILSSPALYLLMDPFNYLLHILRRQQARAQYPCTEHTDCAHARQYICLCSLVTSWLHIYIVLVNRK